jgi:hypothetical protein
LVELVFDFPDFLGQFTDLFDQILPEPFPVLSLDFLQLAVDRCSDFQWLYVNLVAFVVVFILDFDV